MATTTYATLADLKNVGLGVSTSDEDVRATLALSSASRQIDAFCGRSFWQDDSVTVRTFAPSDRCELLVGDVSTTTGLVVKIDADQSGTYETTLTINTDFIVEPVNAAFRIPVWPYTALLAAGPTYRWPLPMYGQPTVQVTAKFGWPAIPDDIRFACILQARHLFKAPDATFGAFSFGDGTAMRMRGMDPTAETILTGYRRVEC